MTGVNVLGITLIFAALLVLAVALLPALVLLVFRKIRGAVFVFASATLASGTIMTVALLTFLDREYSHEQEPLIVMVALTFLVGGVGQFVAAFRGVRTYAAVFGCAVGSMAFLLPPVLVGFDYVPIPVGLDAIAIPLVIASLIMAVAGLVIAIFFPLGSRRNSQGPESTPP